MEASGFSMSRHAPFASVQQQRRQPLAGPPCSVGIADGVREETGDSCAAPVVSPAPPAVLTGKQHLLRFQFPRKASFKGCSNGLSLKQLAGARQSPFPAVYSPPSPPVSFRCGGDGKDGVSMYEKRQSVNIASLYVLYLSS